MLQSIPRWKWSTYLGRGVYAGRGYWQCDVTSLNMFPYIPLSYIPRWPVWCEGWLLLMSSPQTRWLWPLGSAHRYPQDLHSRAEMVSSLRTNSIQSHTFIVASEVLSSSGSIFLSVQAWPSSSSVTTRCGSVGLWIFSLPSARVSWDTPSFVTSSAS